MTNNKDYYDRFNTDICEIIRLVDGQKRKSEGAGDLTLYYGKNNGIKRY